MFGKPNYNYGYPWNSNNAMNTYQSQTQQSNGIVWVQGEAGAKSFLVAPNQSVLLMDSESNVFYIKSSDASGMPMPLRTFDYQERVVAKNETTNTGDFVTREEFEKRIKEIADAQQSLQSVKQQQPKQYKQQHD